jgi:hypothetical protein
MLATLCLLVLASSAQATPLQPNVLQLLQQAEKPAVPYVPARAGWDGPEMTTPSAANSAATVPAGFHLADVLDRAASARAVRNTWLALAIPDPRALAGFGILILLLRKLRQLRETPPQPQAQPA